MLQYHLQYCTFIKIKRKTFLKVFQNCQLFPGIINRKSPAYQVNTPILFPYDSPKSHIEAISKPY